jgi:hypothetical protein
LIIEEQVRTDPAGPGTGPKLLLRGAGTIKEVLQKQESRGGLS